VRHAVRTEITFVLRPLHVHDDDSLRGRGGRQAMPIAVPEPGVLALIALAIGLLVVFTKRR
jgi:hypothetical protein